MTYNGEERGGEPELKIKTRTQTEDCPPNRGNLNLRQRGLVERDLAGTVPSVASYRLRHLPKFLPPIQVKQILESCDRRTALGQHDYAMLLLMARLGLRCGEVAALTLEDFNWERSEFIVRGKGPRHEPLPLPQEVGAALLTYLRHARPDCPGRHTFVRLRAPHRRLADGRSVHYAVQTALRRAGLNPPFKGSHLLHSFAMDLLHHGVDPATIALWLGHEQLETTSMYLQADMQLKQQALTKGSHRNARIRRFRPSDRVLEFLRSL